MVIHRKVKSKIEKKVEKVWKVKKVY